jgi:hypothetical protein
MRREGNPIIPGNPVIPGNPIFGTVPAVPILHEIFGFSDTTVDILGVAALNHDTLANKPADNQQPK